MKGLFFALSLAAAAPLSIAGQGMDLSNVQVHGFATQGFIYSTDNNWNSAESSGGSAAWTEAVVSVTAQPEPYAQADYKFNEGFGFRVGNGKTPAGLFNEIQDVDPAYLWAILPQSIYPIASRNSQLAHYGGVVYGKAAFTSNRYQKDWAIATRYDFNPALYLKAEEHVMDGTELGYVTSDNPGGLKPNTLLTLLKLGVSF